MATVLSVSELTRALREVLESEFPFVWVRGEVSNLSRPASGHVYFTLGDGRAALNVVWFKSSQPKAAPGREAIDPLTGEVLTPETVTTAERLIDGEELLCAGRIGVYEPRGTYQLVAELVQAQGGGDLAAAFEALKRDLAARGFFDEGRKMRLPSNPARVAVVTSLTAAALRDFLRIAGERGTGGGIRIYPTLVQGSQAPAQIALALRKVADDDWAQAVALIRGGGSLEDLWAYNTEIVAQAMFDCPIPIVTGIGHEPDVSIADYVADQRAATPSHAAQALWPRRTRLAQDVDEAARTLARAFARLLDRKEAELETRSRGLAWLSPAGRLARLTDAFAAEAERLRRAGGRLVSTRLVELKPLTIRLQRALGPEALDHRVETAQNLTHRLRRAAVELLERRSRDLELIRSGLDARDPEAPLARGYALVTVRNTGRFLRSVAEAVPGAILDVRTRDGSLTATVTATDHPK